MTRYISILIADTIPLQDIISALTSNGFHARYEKLAGVALNLYVDDKPRTAVALPPLTEKTIGHTVYVTSSEFPTKAAALEVIREYVERYPPAGYGTSLSVLPVEPFKIIGQRYVSCE